VRLDRLESGGAVLCDHDVRDIVGVIESVRIDGDLVGRSVVRFGKSARADEVFNDVVDGIRKFVSVGYIIHDAEPVATRDGMTDTYRVTDWEPYEISLVSVPADASVGVGRSADEESPVIEIPLKSTQEKSIMDKTPEQFAEEKRAAEEKARTEARAAEQKRTNEILTVGADHADIGGNEMAREAITNGDSIDGFQKKLLDAKRDAASGKPLKYGQAARVKDNLADDTKLGYRNLGEFCGDVMRAALGKGESERMTRAATVFGNTENGPDGGFAVPPEFAKEISSIAYAQESLLSLCDNIPLSGNTMTFPKDETTPWGASGITASWEGEGDQATPKKPALGESSMKLRKLRVLVAASDEMVADAMAMSSHISSKMGMAVDWKANDAIINGTGSGQPLGIMPAASTVSQAAEASQTAATINAANITKMYGRCLKGPGARLAWVVHPDAINQIMLLTIGNQPIWTPPQSGMKEAPNGFLLGRPIIESDACQTLGTKGDIILGNFAGYRAITKAAGAEFATSMHLWFDQDLQAFRLIFRLDGQPALSAPMSAKNGSSTRSHFVTLATRA
jgi:HK97 family phage major capsid protein